VRKYVEVGKATAGRQNSRQGPPEMNGMHLLHSGPPNGMHASQPMQGQLLINGMAMAQTGMHPLGSMASGMMAMGGMQNGPPRGVKRDADGMAPYYATIPGQSNGMLQGEHDIKRMRSMPPVEQHKVKSMAEIKVRFLCQSRTSLRPGTRYQHAFTSGPVACHPATATSGRLVRVIGLPLFKP
jgi:hypothetical protein